MAENMQVVVRVRPQKKEQNEKNIIRVVKNKKIIFDRDDDTNKRKQEMSFDRVFDDKSTNEEIFKFSMRPLVASVMQGYNSSVFVYGATDSGKTFTMFGSEEVRGITHLTMNELFEQIDKLKEARNFDVHISYLGVNNEQVMDLLEDTAPLQPREDGDFTWKPVSKYNDLLPSLRLKNRNRAQHAIFQVRINMTNLVTNENRIVKFSMIDLAGSSSTGQSVNKSLLNLGICINNLADGSTHIPYSESKLTKFLKDSLCIDCCTVMICNISPASDEYGRTLNTLDYATT